MKDKYELPTEIGGRRDEEEPTGRRGAGVPPTMPIRDLPMREERPGAPPVRRGMETVAIGGPPPILAFLVITNGPHLGHVFRLNPKVTAIGRDAQNDVILDDDAASRQHAKIKTEGEGKEKAFVIYDQATENGTKVNGELVREQALKDGDEIEVGHTTMVFKKV
jgi:hypothetical protein